MAVYGSNFYGLFTYGSEPLVEFDASPFTARPHYYNTILLNWTKPSGDWSSLVVVRNPLGFAVTADDGDLVLQVTNVLHDSLALPYTDSGASVEMPSMTLGPDTVYYYSIFVSRTSDGKWFRAGNALSVSVADGGTGSLMYDYIPLPYKAINTDDLLSLSARKNLDLANFLNVFGFEYDYFKVLAKSAKNRYDVSNLHGRLVPLMMDEFGLIYEPEMGLAQGRRLLKNAAVIYLTKGSGYGIKAFTKSFSGYNSSIGAIKNLFLTLDDSSFEHSLGHWASSSGDTLSVVSGTSESPTVAPYIESTSPALFPNSTLGIMKAVAATAAIQLTCGTASPVTTGIPVTAGLAYTFSIYSRPKTDARSVKLNIRWYDRDGASLGTAVETSGTNVLSTWTRASVSGTAPTGAVFATVSVKIDGTSASEVHYLDAAQFEQASSATDYVDARRIDIYLDALRVNLAKNPSFASVSTNWNKVSSSANSVSSADSYSGTSSLLLTSNGNAKFGCNQSSIPVTGGSAYTWSMYVKDIDSAVDYKAEITWYDSSATFISSSTGSTTAVSDSEWTRLSVTATAPSNAVTATVAIQSYSSPSSGTQAYFDAALFEQTDSLNRYFDGSAGYLETADLLWEDNDATNGKSYYYKNRLNVTKRLITAIPEYMPIGSTWAIFIGS